LENNKVADIQVNESDVDIGAGGVATTAAFKRFLLWSHSRFSHRL
jgi:hypothetical protein